MYGGFGACGQWDGSLTKVCVMFCLGWVSVFTEPMTMVGLDLQNKKKDRDDLVQFPHFNDEQVGSQRDRVTETRQGPGPLASQSALVASPKAVFTAHMGLPEVC